MCEWTIKITGLKRTKTTVEIDTSSQLCNSVRMNFEFNNLNVRIIRFHVWGQIRKTLGWTGWKCETREPIGQKNL